MRAGMRVILAMAAAGLVGLLVGLGGGWVALGREARPPLDAPPPEPPIAPPLAAPLPRSPTETVDVQKLIAAEPRRPLPTQRPEAGPLRPQTPDVVEETPLVGDPSLLPRGPGRTALLDLGAAGLPSVVVRQGQLSRDGAANWAKFSRNPRVATLQGPQPRVELLHLGFDAEARPVMAHVRTVEPARVEGVIALQAGDVRIPVLADPDPPQLEPIVPPAPAAPTPPPEAPPPP